MTKCVKFLALLLIILAAACGDKSSTTAPMADTPENRKAAAKRYLEVQPPQEMLKSITANMMQRMPEGLKKQFQEAMSDKELIEHTYRISEAALIKHFTPDEMNAMSNFFGSAAGKSARAKYTPYMSEMMPQINEEVKKVFAKMQDQPKKEAEKEGAPKAAEPAKPESPKTATPPKPEPAKPEQPVTPQAKPEKPEAKQPQAEQPKPEKPKNK